MSQFDVFNGDADGLCAVQQLRRARPRPARAVTGLKREIALLDRVPARAGDTVSVLDVSLDRNRAALLRLLEGGVEVEYFDHHHAGEVPRHPALHAFIDTDPATCTCLIVDRHIGGTQPAWAIAGAFGDSQVEPALALARQAGIAGDAVRALRELGEAINHNAYGERDSDVLVHPLELHRMLCECAGPLAFLREPIARALVRRRQEDMERASAARLLARIGGGAVYLLPDEPWARRAEGALASELGAREPERAHAVLRQAAGGGYMVNVRAPAVRPLGADTLCLRFGGGGRARAAGIDRLPQASLDAFLAAFARAFPASPPAGCA